MKFEYIMKTPLLYRKYNRLFAGGGGGSEGVGGGRRLAAPYPIHIRHGNSKV